MLLLINILNNIKWNASDIKLHDVNSDNVAKEEHAFDTDVNNDGHVSNQAVERNIGILSMCDAFPCVGPDGAPLDWLSKKMMENSVTV